MKTVDFNYEISINVNFSKEEFDLLWDAFISHDEVIRYAEPGQWMFGNKNRVEWAIEDKEDIILNFTDHQIDKSCKALELASFGGDWNPKSKAFKDLYSKMYNLHNEIVKQYNLIKSVAK